MGGGEVASRRSSTSSRGSRNPRSRGARDHRKSYQHTERVKAVLECGGTVWHHLAFEYPATQKRAFDDFVTRASYALQAYGRVGCPR
jgi:hypothetical protein